MANVLNISEQDILDYIRFSCQIPGVLEKIATDKIIAQAAQEAGIIVTPEEIQQEGDRLRFTKKLVKAADTWAWLKQNYLSLEDFEVLVRTNLLAHKLAHHLFADKVEKFFYEHQLDYIAAVIYEVTLEDKDLALELFYSLEEGEMSFPDLARIYIPDPALRRIGGYQGIKRRQDFRPEIAAAVFAAIPPQVLKPMTTPKGVHLIWVEEIIKPELDNQLCSQIQQELFSHWLKQQLEQLEIAVHFNCDRDLQQSHNLRSSA